MADSEDSSVMTIEFLRARLLSERSVSRSARQRADQLAKRVTELEEQLRIVTIQRKKAERAATEVLSFLESQGIGSFCEIVDSSSDKDENGVVLIRTTESGNVPEEDNSSNASGIQNRSEVDDACSGSEVEVSPSQVNGLSWKGSRNVSESLERKKIIQTRQGIARRAFLYSPEFSSKRQLGISCRKLKRSGSKDMVANGKNANEHIDMDVKDKQRDELHASHESSVHLQDQQDTCSGYSNHGEDKLGCTTSVEGHNKLFHSNFYASGVINKEEEMELALEKQAQLIDLYQAEEDAQREWEEKFNENHSKMVSSQWVKDPAPADCEYVLIEGTGDDDASHVEGNDTNQAASVAQPDAIISQMIMPGSTPKRSDSNEQTGWTADHCFNAPVASINCNEHTPNGETTGSIDQRCTGSTAIESEDVSQEFEFPGQATDGDRSAADCFQEPVICSDLVSDRNLNSKPHVFSLDDNNLENISPHKFSQEKLSVTQIQLHLSSPQSHGSSLEVLGSLQRAKLSLRRQLDRIPQPASKTWEAAADSQTLSVQQRLPNKGLNVPIGSASLFRLPTDPLPSFSFIGSPDIKSSLDVKTHHSGIGFTTSGAHYRETKARTYMRPQDYDYSFTSGSRLAPFDPTRYSYSIFDTYPTRNISSTGTQISHMGIHNDSSQNPYSSNKIDGIGPSWRIR